MKRLQVHPTFGLGLAALIPLVTGCEQPSAVQAGNSHVEVASQVDPTKTVCDPFGGTQGGAPGQGNNGVWGRLYYLDNTQPQYTHVMDYQKYGHDAGVDLYMNQIFVPTQPFDRGFQTQSGTILKTPAGDTLYEWFSLHLETQVKLGRNDRAARYQFAVLSDDGAIVSIQPPGQEYFSTLINNDGFTSSRLACASTSVQMSAGMALPMRIDYFQGPRYHLALVLLWREVPASSASNFDARTDTEGSLTDDACGYSANDGFFDYTQSPPAPTARWLGMLSRGWKVLSIDNFALPASKAQNPCTGNGSGGGVLGV